MDPENGVQPMTRRAGDNTYSLVYNGELYNAPELKKELELCGHRFLTACDTEVLLVAFIEWGRACVDRFNGIFAFAVWDDEEQTLFAARDRLGVKPFFFPTRTDGFCSVRSLKPFSHIPIFPPKSAGRGWPRSSL